MRKWLVLLIAAAVVVALQGCAGPFGSEAESEEPASEEQSGEPTELVLDLSPFQAQYNVDKVEVELSRQGTNVSKTRQLNIDKPTQKASGSISLAEGTWDVTVRLYEGSTKVASGTGSISVTAGDSTSETITVSSLGSEPVELDIDYQ